MFTQCEDKMSLLQGESTELPTVTSRPSLPARSEVERPLANQRDQNQRREEIMAAAAAAAAVAVKRECSLGH